MSNQPPGGWQHPGGPQGYGQGGYGQGGYGQGSGAPQGGFPAQGGGFNSGHGQQPGQSGPPPGYLHLTIQGSAMTSNMLTPNVIIDGRHYPASYGSNTFPLPPGPHQLEMYAQWMRKYGQAQLQFNVAPGQQVPVFYRAPLHQFTTGSIGHEKQSPKGKGCLFAIIGIVVLMILFVIVAAVAAGS